MNYPNYLTYLIATLFLHFNASAQEPPHLSSPVHTSQIQTLNPTLQWEGNWQTNNYDIEVFICYYDEGPYANELDLNAYTLSQTIDGGDTQYEASGLMYNENSTNAAFMTVTDGGLYPGNQNKIFDNNFNVGTTLTTTVSADNEGISHIYGNIIGVLSEATGIISVETIVGNTLSQIATLNLNYTNGNIGLEGFTYNPLTKTGYVCSESNENNINDLPNFWSFNLPDQQLSGNYSLNKTNLGYNLGIADASGLYHLGQEKALAGLPVSENLLVISEFSDVVYEVTPSGNIVGNINLPGNNVMFQPEGIAYHNGNIYIASERDNQAPTQNDQYYIYTNPNHQNPIVNILNNIPVFTASTSNTTIAVSNNSLQSNTQYCWTVSSNINGTIVESEVFSFTTPSIAGCTNPLACNYNVNADIDNGSCIITYSACTTAGGNNGIYNSNCACNCISTTFLSGNISSNTFHVSNFVKSDGSVLNGENVIFKAGNYVELLPGFEVDQNSMFLAEIVSCQ